MAFPASFIARNDVVVRRETTGGRAWVLMTSPSQSRGEGRASRRCEEGHLSGAQSSILPFGNRPGVVGPSPRPRQDPGTCRSTPAPETSSMMKPSWGQVRFSGTSPHSRLPSARSRHDILGHQAPDPHERCAVTPGSLSVPALPKPPLPGPPPASQDRGPQSHDGSSGALSRRERS